MHILPISLDDLLHARSVEMVRRELKKTWSEPILDQVIRTVCAFANDFFNLNGGYIVLGVEEQDGLPILPPYGLEDCNLDEIQKEIRGQCKRIDPEYQPIISPELYQDKQIAIIWCPAGDVRPYHAPESKRSGERKYYVRQGSQTVEAKGDILTQLMQMTAKVPFDDRRQANLSVDVLSSALVRSFLSDIKSDLVTPGVNIRDLDLYRFLRISVQINGYDAPRNVALLFFVTDPEQFFSGARIEVVQFGDDAGGNLIEEKTFRGPIHLQIRQALDYLNSFSTTMVRKVPDQAEAFRTVAFPYEAMEEAVVNAVYHRSYEGMTEPAKVYLYPDRMEVISYPGPVPGLELRHFQLGISLPPVPNRNRRIGEFLKELRLAEGRGTGIPKIRRKMSENGSPDPIFDFDEGRTYFRVILPAHPQYVVINALRESAHLWAIGERQAAIANLEVATRRAPHSGALIAQIIEYKMALGEDQTAESLLASVEADPLISDKRLPYLALARFFLDQQNPKRASEILARVPPPSRAEDVVELAVLYKRSSKFQQAHKIFAANYDLIKDNPKAVHEYAQTKYKLSQQTSDHSARKRLVRDEVELLRRAIQLSDNEVRCAWCWYDLARALAGLGSPETEVLQAYSRAMELLPDEPRFRESYDNWRRRNS